MARGRMLDQSFAKSHKLRGCSRDARLAYVMILPFLDRQGRHVAEPLVLKATVFRWSDYTIEEIAAVVKELQAAELVRLYADEDNDAILEYVDFLRFNNPNNKEAKSAFPGPDDDNALPVRDEALTSHEQAPGNAQAKHVQSTGNAEGERNGTLTINDQRNVKHSSEHPAPATAPQLAASPPRTSHDPGLFMEVWNTNRGRLPAVTTLNAKRKSAIRSLVKEHGPDKALDLFRDAVRAVASDDFWRSRQYGLDTLLTGNKVLARAEQWRNGATQLGEGNARIASTAESVARAIGGLDDLPN